MAVDLQSEGDEVPYGAPTAARLTAAVEDLHTALLNWSLYEKRIVVRGDAYDSRTEARLVRVIQRLTRAVQAATRKPKAG